MPAKKQLQIQNRMRDNFLKGHLEVVAGMRLRMSILSLRLVSSCTFRLAVALGATRVENISASGVKPQNSRFVSLLSSAQSSMRETSV
jgi:hypothetical protein